MKFGLYKCLLIETTRIDILSLSDDMPVAANKSKNYFCVYAYKTGDRFVVSADNLGCSTISIREFAVIKSYKLNLSLVLVACVGLGFSALSGWVLYNIENKSITREFQKDIDDRAASVYRELSINFEALRSLAILFRQGKIPSYLDFSLEAKKIINRYDNIQALEWVPRITSSRQQEYVDKIRNYFPEFEIRQKNKQGLMERAKDRPEYYPVYFVEPFIGNQGALGFDLASSATRLATLSQSRDTAQPLATASITLVQEKAKQRGFLAFIPVYKGAPATVESRREKISGFILGVFRVGDIFESSALTGKSNRFEIRLVDETSQEAADLLYTHAPPVGDEIDSSVLYHKKLPNLWGRQWALMASPTTDYIANKKDNLAYVVFAFGSLFTLMIVLILSFVARRNVMIKEQVNQQTAELSEANNKLKILSRSDELTGMYNRRYMNEFLQTEWQRAIRNKTYISFLLIDIDYFKAYNDSYGHLLGDECLIEVSSKLRSIPSRPTDMIARFGGEEFALILAETKNPLPIANTCRELIQNLQIRHQSSLVSEVVTISIGVCSCIPKLGTDPSVIIDLADKALYVAKESGRNRVEVAIADLQKNIVSSKMAS